MDSIEKKLKAYYQNKKQEDEESAPDFEAFWDKLKPAKATNQAPFFLRIAASIAIVATALLYYFYGSNPPAKEMQEISKINLDQPLPSQIFLDQSLDAEYIWKWKAPTDQLLKDVDEFMNTGINKKS